ncbi:response regulator transcription factor [Nocardioides sp. CFH 31398]|uniref:response regulator n=1 Tax=Nocardioides sp. CFH 31398 TaxID=2919579 RepID=UPI001F063AFB|nr:response regulator transcription factor [Nocardioides sp. CFH 31398]MCH1866453.1 response regulator transcription factor [Nocardioides sp. CFH 31398]
MADPGSVDAAVSVLVADDQELFRRGLALLLDGQDGLSVVATASDAEGAVAEAARTTPDVVVLEGRMSGRGGLEACRRITARHPGVRVIVLSTSDDEADLFEAVRGGALGYLLKDASLPELVQAVQVVAAGQSLISPAMAAKLVSGFREAEVEEENPSGAARLTARELEVLTHVARGLANREVAARLSISENTVKNHVRNILEKLGLHSRMEAVMYAMRTKLLDMP